MNLTDAVFSKSEIDLVKTELKDNIQKNLSLATCEHIEVDIELALNKFIG